MHSVAVVVLQGFYEALTRPGPDLVICDEGHRIKNCGASTSRALKNIQTRLVTYLLWLSAVFYLFAIELAVFPTLARKEST